MKKKECPFCGELIQNGALKCRYCREWLSEQVEPIIENEEVSLGQAPSVNSKEEEKIEEVIILATPIEDITPIAPEKEEEEDTIDMQSQEEVLSHSQVDIEPAPIEIIEVEEEVEIEDLHEEIIEEEEVIVPLVQIPVAPAIQEEEEEEEEETELVRWQSFKSNKILTILTFILSCIASYFSYIEIKDELTIRSVLLTLITMMLNTYIYYQLYLYLRNFDVFDELQTTMKLMLGCYIFSCIGVVLFFILYHYTNAIYLIFPIASLASLLILWLIVGWKLWKRTDDFVGGLERFGQFTFISFFIPGMGILSPLFLYKVFANAQEHIEEYGYLDDDENDY